MVRLPQSPTGELIPVFAVLNNRLTSPAVRLLTRSYFLDVGRIYLTDGARLGFVPPVRMRRLAFLDTSATAVGVTWFDDAAIRARVACVVDQVGAWAVRYLETGNAEFLHAVRRRDMIQLLHSPNAELRQAAICSLHRVRA